MTHHVPNPHPPDVERRLSNVGHWIEGAMITAAGIRSLRQAFDDNIDAGPASPVLTAAGIVLGGGLVAGSFQHGGPVTFFRNDHQQRQHLEMAALLTAASVAWERGTFGTLAAGTALAAVGGMFLTHEQHGTGDAANVAKRRHRRLGGTIVCGAALLTAGQLLRRKRLEVTGSALMAAAGVQLVAYREPEGAFKDGP